MVVAVAAVLAESAGAVSAGSSETMDVFNAVRREAEKSGSRLTEASSETEVSVVMFVGAFVVFVVS